MNLFEKKNSSFYGKLVPLKLVPGVIHLWLAFPDEIRDVSLLKAYYGLMTSEERVRCNRFRFARHQHQFAITRALVRTTLSRYSHIQPHEWRFDKNQYGRPEIKGEQNSLGLRFNLSHTKGLIVCGLIKDAPRAECTIGVDVENIKRESGSIEIGQRFFSECEAADLQNLPEKESRLRFFDYWTLKEAYIKACGMGLSIPLKKFSFHITRQAPLSISFAPELNDEPKSWQFWLLSPTQHHRVALAVRFKGEQNFQPVVKKVTPLLEEKAFKCPIIH